MTEHLFVYGLNGLYIIGIPLAIAVTSWHGGRVYQAHRYHQRGKHRGNHLRAHHYEAKPEPRLKLVSVEVHEANPYRRTVGGKG